MAKGGRGNRNISIVGGGRTSAPAKNETLQRIEVNPNWAYQPDANTDPYDIVKNPIPFVGNGKDWEIGETLENETKQTKYDGDYEIEIDKVKTLQPFVLQSGIDDYKRFDFNEKPYVVEFEGNYYLLDGNHRMARAKLKRQKTMNVTLSVRSRR